MRYEADDKEILDYIAESNEDIHISQGPVFLLDIFPWLVKFTPNIVYDKIMNVPLMIQHTKRLNELILVSDHEEVFADTTTCVTAENE